MRVAEVQVHGRRAGLLRELPGGGYRFAYDAGYDGAAVSLTMPLSASTYTFAGFPPYFDGVLPEGPQLEALLRQRKLDRHDLLGQLLAVGCDLVGAVTVTPLPDAP